jgi:MFS family permease
MVASAIVTYLITATAAWGYPQGAATIWPIGLVAMAFVIGFGFKPFLTSWRADRAGRRDA